MSRNGLDVRAGGGTPPETQLPLIRNAHIFSSAVHEILETQILQSLPDLTVTLRQLQLLRYIAVARHHIDDVAGFLGVSTPAASRAVDMLERRGLVVRNPSQEDRRLTFLACSERGRRLLQRVRMVEQKRIEAALAGFSDDDNQLFSALLARYSVAIIGIEPPLPTPCLRCFGYYDDACAVQLVHSSCPYQGRASAGAHAEEKSER